MGKDLLVLTNVFLDNSHCTNHLQCSLPFLCKIQVSYEPKYNVAYIRFHEKLGQVTTIKISDDMNIDIAPDGTVYGVELLNANEQLTRDHGALIVESGGERQEIPLVA